MVLSGLTNSFNLNQARYHKVDSYWPFFSIKFSITTNKIEISFAKVDSKLLQIYRMANIQPAKQTFLGRDMLLS